MRQTFKQPWHEDDHKPTIGEDGKLYGGWADDSHIQGVLDVNWGWLMGFIQSPPKLPITYGHLTFSEGYFEHLEHRRESLEANTGAVRRAEARNLAYELWIWFEIDKRSSRGQADD